MKNKSNIILLLNRLKLFIVLTLFSLSLSNCSGCSQSGVKKRADRKTGRDVTNYSQNEPVRNQHSTNQQSDTQLTLNKLFKRYQSSVFMVFTSNGEQGYQGTGFFISSDGIAVSNYHIFEGTSKGLEIIKTYNDQKFKIEKVISQSKNDDYIIFKVRLNSSINFAPIPIAKNNPDIGEDVFAIGNPYGMEHTLSKGIVSGFRANNNLIQTTTEITHGSSGGPLLNMQGEVVGITTVGFSEADLNFAVNIQVLQLYKYL